MINTIIIDDEQHCIDRIVNLVDFYDDTFNIIGYYTTVDEAVKATELLRPELVFLDVKIHNKTGFDYLKQLSEITFEIVFTTAYERYAVQAFKFSALDYLLKPIDSDDFNEVVIKIKNKLENGFLNEQIKVLFHNLQENGFSKKISLPTVSGYTFIEISEIIHCQADINYTHVFTIKNEKITVSKTLKTFEELLLSYHFYRVHNSHIINLDFVKTYTKGKGGYVTMQDGSNIKVSTRRKDDFLKCFLAK